MSVPLAIEGMDALALAQEGERLCRENNMKAGIKYLEMALQKKINLGGRSLEALSAIYSQLGNAYFVLRIFDKALEYHQHDLETAKVLGDRSGLAKAHGNLGNTYKALGDFDSAYEHAVAHLRLAQEINDKECEARALYNVASVYHCRAKTIIHASEPLDKSGLLTASDMTATSQLQAAINCYLQNLHIVENLKDFAACGRTYGNIGNSYYMLGDYATAVYYHNKRLDIARRYGDRAAMRRAYTNLGNAHIFLSETTKALEYYRLALSIATELHDEVIEAQCCFNVGNGAAISGDHITATEYHIRYLKLVRKQGDRTGEARAYAALATDFRKQNMMKKAIYFLILQGHLSIEMGDQGIEESARSSLEDLLKSMDKWPVKEADDLEMDSSSDPEPRNASELSISLQKLLSEAGSSADVDNGRQPVSISTLTVTDDQPIRLTSYDDDFFEMVSRLQSKRLNDQRCDPIILNDLTNYSKNITRQSDTIVCNPDGAEGMLDLIASLQGRRMEEQRAHLSIQSDTISLSVESSDDVKDDGDNVQQRTPPTRMQRSRSEDAGSLYEMVIRSQRDRLDEQRSELPRTIPAEDVSQIVMSMQKGRIETQRATLSSPPQS